MAGAHVFNFNDPAIDSDFEAKFDGLRGAKSRIIDLRYNSRGSSDIGYAIESHFVDAPVEGSKQSTLPSKTVVLCRVEVGLRGGSEPCVPFFSWEWSDPSDQFFSFVSVGDFVNCANPSSADFTCSAYGPFGSNCKHLR